MSVSARKQSLFALLQKHITSTNIGETAVLMAYYALLSIFPLMLALGNLLPVFDIDPASLMPYLDEIVPEAVRSILNPILEQLLTTGNGGLFSLGMVAVLWSASNGVSQLEKGLDHAYGIVDKRHNIVQKAMSVVAVILALLLFVALAFVFGLGSTLLDQLATVVPAAGQIAASISGLKWPVTVVILFCILLSLYVWAPAAKVRVRDALPGALLAVVGWMLLVVTFSLYLQFMTKTLNTYGVLSTFFILMFWFNFACMIVLLGAALNAALYEYRHDTLIMKKHPVSQKVSDKIEGIFKRFERKKKPEKTEEPEIPEKSEEPEEAKESGKPEKSEND